ncbi:MAG: 6-bladed beta-propeller [Candidatus Sabulitectum sp.]|nr:6-bladed beta-propeller [Candidatus Sabulitectum sp.]
MKFLLILPLILLLIAGCGASEPTDDVVTEDTTDSSAEEEEYTLPVADSYLHVTDSIGVEIGDSNYVFGAIVGTGFAKNGDIAILDAQKSSVSLFSADGEFIRTVGRDGSGPGEFLLPVTMAFRPEGGLIVADAMGSKLVYFDENYEYLSETTGFIPSPPGQIVAIDGMEFIGMKPDWEQNEDGMFMGFTVAKWTMDSSIPVTVYHSEMSPFNPTDLSAMSDDLALFTATADGTVFTAPMSTEEYSFTAWTSEGEEIYTYVNEDFERVEKTQSEMDLETELVNAQMIAQGMPPSMANWEPVPYRNSISLLFIDGIDRLWVSKGTSDTDTFDVFDLDGNFLFTAALDAGEASKTWGTMIGREKFICFDANPEDYPRVFYGDLPGFE